MSAGKTRIARASKGVKLLAHALFWVTVIAGVVGVYSASTTSSEPVRTVMAYSAALAVVMAALLRHVVKLSMLYENGDLFVAGNVHHLKWIGRLALLTAVGPRLGPDGAGGMGVSVDFHPVIVVVSLVVIFVSWVMDEARQLREEHELVI
ncbi:MAG: DUF2975 domain-containing protein [Myxococcota bacterium]